MSESSPDDELRALIAMEKATIVDPGPARGRLAERLGPLLVPPAVAPAVLAPRLSGWRLAAAGLGTFVLGGATGAALHARSTPPRTEIRYVDRIVEVDRASDGGVLQPPSPPNSALPVVSVPSDRPARVERPPAAAASSTASDDALARERQVIEKARSALARGDADGALAAASEHARAFPRGQLSEAREAIAVRALAHAGRHQEARMRADRFRRTFPGSMYSPVVEAAISSIP
jgi:hypothetical protein